MFLHYLLLGGGGPTFFQWHFSNSLPFSFLSLNYLLIFAYGFFFSHFYYFKLWVPVYAVNFYIQLRSSSQYLMFLSFNSWLVTWSIWVRNVEYLLFLLPRVTLGPCISLKHFFSFISFSFSFTNCLLPSICYYSRTDFSIECMAK